MNLLQTFLQLMNYKIFILFLLINSVSAYSCDKAQMIDYDYQIKEVLGDGYSTFGRIWSLDGQQSCVNSIRYSACINIKPLGDFADLSIEIIKEKGTSSQYNQKIKYNSSEVIRFNAMSANVYLKLYVSNAIADRKMAGKACENGFPNIPRYVTRKELDNMFKS